MTAERVVDSVPFLVGLTVAVPPERAFSTATEIPRIAPGQGMTMPLRPVSPGTVRATDDCEAVALAWVKSCPVTDLAMGTSSGGRVSGVGVMQGVGDRSSRDRCRACR